jgi:hypothetical protein
MTGGCQAAGFWPHITFLRTSWTWAITTLRNQQSRKWRQEPIHAVTSSGIELRWPRPAQQKTNTAWSALGTFRGCSHPYFFFPALLPSETFFYGLSYGLFERFYVLKRLVIAEIDWLKTMRWRELRYPLEFASACALWPSRSCFEMPLKVVDFSGYFCSCPQE